MTFSPQRTQSTTEEIIKTQCVSVASVVKFHTIYSLNQAFALIRITRLVPQNTLFARIGITILFHHKTSQYPVFSFPTRFNLPSAFNRFISRDIVREDTPNILASIETEQVLFFFRIFLISFLRL